MRSKFVRSTADKENRNIGVRDRCLICWFRLWRVNKSKLSSVSSLSKEPFRVHRILGNELVCRLGMHLTSGGMPLNGIAQSDKAGCQTTCFSHRIGRNIWQWIFVFKLHVDISSGFTYKVSGACALREQVSQFCNICVLSRQTDAALGGFHLEGATINSSWNEVKWHVNCKFSNIKSGKNK